MGDDHYRRASHRDRTSPRVSSGGSAARPTAQGHYRGFHDRSESNRGMPGRAFLLPLRRTGVQQQEEMMPSSRDDAETSAIHAAYQEQIKALFKVYRLRGERLVRRRCTEG